MPRWAAHQPQGYVLAATVQSDLTFLPREWRRRIIDRCQPVTAAGRFIAAVTS